MATILELAQMSSDVKQGTANANQPTQDLTTGLGSQWVVFATSSALMPLAWAQGYFAVAYRNTLTGQIVIANRGTELIGAGVNTALQNLVTDFHLLGSVPTVAQDDAISFAKLVVAQLGESGGFGYTDIVETGHSLGGSEAQAAVAALSDNGTVAQSEISGVVFNSPGIGGAKYLQAANYNVVDLYEQGDAVHVAGGTHLGGLGNLINLAAGPNTSQLVIALPGGVASGTAGIVGLLGTALYQTLGPGHSIATLINYLSPGQPGSNVGAVQWTSLSSPSSIPESPVNPSLPYFGVTAPGNLTITDPSTNITATLAIGPSNSQSVLATFSGGSSALAQALASLGGVQIPISQLGQSLGAIAGAATLSETITRNAAGTFDVTFQQGTGAANPGSGVQFSVQAANPANAFDYAIPGSGQTIVETIDNGMGNSLGSVAVLGAATTTLTGGGASQGQTNSWTDSLGDQYGARAANVARLLNAVSAMSTLRSGHRGAERQPGIRAHIHWLSDTLTAPPTSPISGF